MRFIPPKPTSYRIILTFFVRRRGKSGGQVRDEYREDFDLGRGGPGAAQRRLEAMEAERRKEEDEYGRGR